MLGSKRLTRAGAPRRDAAPARSSARSRWARRRSGSHAYALWGTSSASRACCSRAGPPSSRRLNPYAVLVARGVRRRVRGAVGARARADRRSSSAGLSRRLAHRPDGPVWITHARLFDPVSGTAAPGKNVVLYRDRIVGVRADPPPAGATVIDGAGRHAAPGTVRLPRPHRRLGGAAGTSPRGVTFRCATRATTTPRFSP